MTDLVDDLGALVPLPAPPARVVSLVPSLTEAIAVTCPGLLVAATDFCTQPTGLDVERIRGPKNPAVRRIVALRPDLVIANQEENRALDVERLRAAGIPVWVTKIDSVAEALDSLERLLRKALGASVPDWLRAARDVWAAPPRLAPVRVAVPVWRDPWLWVGAGTYPGDLLRHLGAVNAVEARRYPKLPPGELHELTLVVLPDEPYSFTTRDLGDVPAAGGVTVAGRHLFWYGPAMVAARDALEGALRPFAR